MYSIVLLVVLFGLSLVISRIGTIALASTGMARPSAQFQARSALTGVGFTTRESEAVVSHPVRRRIVMSLMVVGNLGLATAVATLLVGFVGAGGREAGVRAAVLVGGVVAVILVSRSRPADRWLTVVLTRWLSRHTDIEVRDYAGLLRLAGEYGVTELLVHEGDWLAGRSLGQLRLRDEGVLVLGIVRPDGGYVGAPHKDTEVRAGDLLILYGRDDVLERLDRRPRDRSGDREHALMMEETRRARATDPRP